MESVGSVRVRDRQWKLTSEARMVGHAEVVCKIYLEPTGVLSTGSVEELASRGIVVWLVTRFCPHGPLEAGRIDG